MGQGVGAARSGRNPPAGEEIVEAGLCIGCGLCQSLAGADRVALIETSAGRERPVVRRELDRATLELINDVCPGVRVDAADRARLPAGTPVDRIWGPAARLVIGYGAHSELRDSAASGGGLRPLAASGGVLSALADHLLNSGAVEFVVHVAPRQRQPMRSGRHVSVDRAQ